MFRDILEIIQEFIKRMITSRLFALAIIFSLMFAMLAGKLFQMQIVDGEDYLNKYVQKTLKKVYTPGTRGNIYDRKGNLLAYNELAYSVTIQDVGAYKKTAARNLMFLRLVEILRANNQLIEGKFEVAIDANGDIIYTTSTETARKRFLRDLYGLKSVDQLDDENGKYPSNLSAREVFEKKKEDYELNIMKDDKGNPIILSDEVALDIINIRYTMSFTAYQKYETTTVSSNVSENTVAEILENTAELPGVSIAESTTRIYNDSIYFAPIIGYTGKMQEDQLEELQKQNQSYELSDIVGRIGIESYMESELQGTKGEKELFVDSLGRILQEKENPKEPTAGHDVYLTIDRDLQIGIYYLIEQQLAGILVEKLKNEEADVLNKVTDASKRNIPIKDAYYQLINNNVLSLRRMVSEDASQIEQQIQYKFESSREQILQNIQDQLYSDSAIPMNELPDDMAAYMQYIYNYLSDATVGIVVREQIDRNSDSAKAWKDGTISLREYLYSGIANSWIDTTKLQTTNKYSNADDSFKLIVDYLMEQLVNDTLFSKKIYRYLVNNGTIAGRELCLALYAQEVLPYDEQQVAMLQSNGEDYAYQFMIEKISNIDITPAQLALDPCTGGCVVTDVNTGEVRALVTYPSYDNNNLSGTVDGAYYSQLNDDLSRPLYNNATQVLKAPGSTFKPITAIAGLEEKVISLTDTVDCTGTYEDVSPVIRCWKWPGYHGELNVTEGIRVSCNYFFAEVAHRLSMNDHGMYSADRGLEMIKKYATMFGLDHPSGIEINESSPEISSEDPERSSMGQGSHAYNNVQLSRYTAALANRGKVFELSLLDKLTDSNGNLIKDFTPEVSSQVEISESTWDAVQQGMREVVTLGSAKDIFKDLEVDIAGKTGTAQESKTRANHAFFISYAPFQNPDICVTVNIPYGYASSQAAMLAKNVYRFYYDYTDLNKILHTGALDVPDVVIGD